MQIHNSVHIRKDKDAATKVLISLLSASLKAKARTVKSKEASKPFPKALLN